MSEIVPHVEPTVLDEISESIAEVQQPRSRFQLERFVVGQHATEEMRFYQVCLELQAAIFSYRKAKIAVTKQELKIAKLRATGDELDELKAQEREIGLEQTRLMMVGAERELVELVDIYKSFDRKYSREEIEAAAPEYWAKRLGGNARAQLMAGGTVNPSHIEAMEQAGILESFAKSVGVSVPELESE